MFLTGHDAAYLSFTGDNDTHRHNANLISQVTLSNPLPALDIQYSSNTLGSVFMKDALLAQKAAVYS